MRRASQSGGWIAVVAVTALLTACGDDVESGMVSAFVSTDGTMLWTAPTEPTPIEILTDGKWVVTLGATRGCDSAGQVAVLDAETGNDEWSIDTSIEGVGPRQIALADDLVVKAGGSVVMGIEVATGDERWSIDAGSSGNVLVAGGDDTVIIGTNASLESGGNAQLQSIAPADGTTRWEVPIAGFGQLVDVALAGSAVVVRFSGTARENVGVTTVAALEQVDGSVRWFQDLGISEVAEEINVSADHVVVGLRTYAFTVSNGSTLDEIGPKASIIVLDTATGDERWRIDRKFELTDEAARDIQALDNDDAVVVARDGEQFVALDAFTGARRWAQPGFVGDAWIIGPRVLSVPSRWTDGRDSNLDALDQPSGEPLWSHSSNGSTRRAIGDGDVIFAVAVGRSPSCD